MCSSLRIRMGRCLPATAPCLPRTPSTWQHMPGRSLNSGAVRLIASLPGRREPVLRVLSYMFVTVPLQNGLGRAGWSSWAVLPIHTDLESRLLFTLAAGSLVTLIIALLGGYWLADRAMRPVHTITQAARTIGETDLSRRLNMKSKDELGELANTFDGMLGRLQAAFERQRQFVADASHELRTPLTIVNLETSRTLASPRKPEEYRHALAIIHSENDFMTALVNDLLTLARMDAGQAVMEKSAGGFERCGP